MRLGDRQDAFAVEGLALAEAQLADLAAEGNFHACIVTSH
jgi:hypothetical protein